MKPSIKYTLQIDHRSLVSKPDQIADQIKTLILMHERSPKLADPDFLCKQYNLDKQDVLAAFEILVRDQTFDYNKATNTYFITYSESNYFSEGITISIVDIIKSLNQTLHIKTFDDALLPQSTEILKPLGFDKDDQIYYQKRIYYGDTHPKAYMELYFSTKHLPNIMLDTYKKMPYYDIVGINNPQVDSKYNLRLKTRTFSKEINKYLNQSLDSSGFLSEEFYYNDSSNLILYVNIYLNSNYFIRLQS